MNHLITRKILFVLICTLMIIPSSLLLAEEAKDADPAATEESGEEILLEHESGFYYIVREGDTLWDLSQKYSDTPWEWPELWRNNKRIANPHRLYPGDRLRLYHHKRVERFMRAVEEPPYYVYFGMEQVGFIRTPPVEPVGQLFKQRFNKIMIDAPDTVYIMPERGDDGKAFTPGSRLFAYRTTYPLKNTLKGKRIGTQHYLTGIIEIEKANPDIAVGRVTKAFRPISSDDFVMPYQRLPKKLILKESPEGLVGTIINNEDKEIMSSDGAIVFIDKGEVDGVEPGQFYNIYSQEIENMLAREKDYFFRLRKKVALPALEFGKLLVLRVEKTTATALVTYADHNFEKGTKFRSPPR